MRGFPTILVISPDSEEVVKRWGGELYNTKVADFVASLEQAISQIR